jgi:hypothetical protein
VTKINGSQWGLGVWTADNTIIFDAAGSGLRRVSTEGGAVSDLTTLNAMKGDGWHFFPRVWNLPG